ncbi:type IV pilus biogenesis/stability protein PilW [Nocardia sp. BMG51109]|uniref:tetratricopeptide repeat protein n=1 Tax=Nocardia sp. BMG51109 TaxID=1056816 RepID=UPI0004634684|nr:tetratricopeptide repeat protein [Nocardia sp. BMG51109]
MTSVPERPAEPAGEPGSSLDVISKSSVWQGFLSGSSVIATSILLEIVSKLLESWVDESRMLVSVSSWLSRVAALVVVSAGAYLLWRKATEVRMRWRAERDIRMTADLVPPGPEVRAEESASPLGAESASGMPVDALEPARGGGRPALPDDPVVAVLKTLPFAEYETAALYEMVSAMGTVGVRLPSREAGDLFSERAEIDRLVAAGLVHRVVRDRVRVRWQPPAGGFDRRVVDGDRWQAAVPALIRYHADRARRWSAALDSARLAVGARRWFESEGEYLRNLLSTCLTLSKENALPAGVGDLVHIADALDSWYARNGWDAMRTAVADIVWELTRPLDGGTSEFPLEHDLAAIRAGRTPVEAGSGAGQATIRAGEKSTRALSVTWLHRYRAGLSARWDQRLARIWLGRPGGLGNAERALKRAWNRLPRKDVVGEVSVLIDLSVVHLYQGRLEAARNRLAVAESLARNGRDPSGLAQVYETLGVLWWLRGEPRRALRHWQRALTRYRDLDHRLGISRCLRHLGSVVRVAPEYGSLLVDETDENELRRRAERWCADADALRPTSPREKREPERREPAAEPASEGTARRQRDIPPKSGSAGLGPGVHPAGPHGVGAIDHWPAAAPDERGS